VEHRAAAAVCALPEERREEIGRSLAAHGKKLAAKSLFRESVAAYIRSFIFAGFIEALRFAAISALNVPDNQEALCLLDTWLSAAPDHDPNWMQVRNRVVALRLQGLGNSCWRAEVRGDHAIERFEGISPRVAVADSDGNVVSVTEIDHWKRDSLQRKTTGSVIWHRPDGQAGDEILLPEGMADLVRAVAPTGRRSIFLGYNKLAGERTKGEVRKFGYRACVGSVEHSRGLLWTTCLGGSAGDDVLADLISFSDGSSIFCGHTQSKDAGGSPAPPNRPVSVKSV